MAFSNKTDRFYMDEEDIDGALLVLYDAMCADAKCIEDGEADAAIKALLHMGAFAALEIVKGNKRIDTGRRFALLFDRYIDERILDGIKGRG